MAQNPKTILELNEADTPLTPEDLILVGQNLTGETKRAKVSDVLDLVPPPPPPPPSALADLTDVDADSPEDGQVLAWDEDEGKWVPAAGGGGGGGGALADLSDVDLDAIAPPGDFSVLTYHTSLGKWFAYPGGSLPIQVRPLLRGGYMQTWTDSDPISGETKVMFNDIRVDEPGDVSWFDEENGEVVFPAEFGASWYGTLTAHIRFEDGTAAGDLKARFYSSSGSVPQSMQVTRLPDGTNIITVTTPPIRFSQSSRFWVEVESTATGIDVVQQGSWIAVDVKQIPAA